MDVIVDTDVTPVTLHAVIGDPQTVPHAGASSDLFFSPPAAVVAATVQATWQLLTVIRLHDEDGDDEDSDDEDGDDIDG